MLRKLKYVLRQIGVDDRFDPATEESYLDFKFNDSKGVVTSVAIATVFLTIGLWVWDLALDPFHAMNALPSRVLMGVVIGIYPIALIAGLRRTILSWLLALLVLAVEALFLYHLTLLTHGLVYGLSGFMYWFMISVFTGLSFSLTPTLLIHCRHCNPAQYSGVPRTGPSVGAHPVQCPGLADLLHRHFRQPVTGQVLSPPVSVPAENRAVSTN